LAVGDAEFQKKAIGKMQDISKGDGRTVLFVSHNMAAVKSLCTRGILMENGLIAKEGSVIEVLNTYKERTTKAAHSKKWSLKTTSSNDRATLSQIEVKNKDNDLKIENNIELEIEFYNFINNQILNVSISLFDDKDNYVLSSPNLNRIRLKKGLHRSTCTIPKNLLNIGKYSVTVLLVGEDFEIIMQIEKAITFELGEEGVNRGGYFGYWGGVVRPILNWTNKFVGVDEN